MSSDWNKLRVDFPITRKSVYLDHASGGIIPRPVARQIREYSRTLLQEGDFAWTRWIYLRESVRRKIARFIHAEPSEIAFTTSTSQGMNFIAELLSRSGKILTNESEFPTSTLPWLWRKAPVIFQKEEKGAIPLAKLKAMLKPEVKVILTSYVQYATGYRQDLEALGRIKGKRYLVVNATQGFGAFPIDVRKWNADFLCTNSYKWFLAGYGGGILYMKKRWLNKFKPEGVGWRSMQKPDEMKNQKIDLRKDAGRYEWGCPSFMAIFAMGAAVDYMNAIGPEKIAQRIIELTDYAIDGLQKKGFEVVSPLEREHRSGIVAFRVKEPEKIWRRCLRKKIFISVRGKGLRLAPHFYNTHEEIDRLLKVLTE